MRLLVLSIVMLACSLSAQAQLQLTPEGGEFRVNSATASDQDTPRVSCSAQTGGCIVVWKSGESGNQGIFAQRYDATGAAMGGLLHVADDERAATVGTSELGEFVVAWDRDAGTEWQVVSRGFDADGTPITSTPSTVYSASRTQGDQVIGCNDNHFCIIVWDDQGAAVRARRLLLNGLAMGNQIEVAPIDNVEQAFPAVAVSNSGRFMIVWHVLSPDSEGLDESRVMARTFAPSGNPEGTAFEVARTRNQFGDPAGLGITIDDNTETFIVTWDSQLHADSTLQFQPRPGEIFVQRIDGPNRTLLGAPILVAAIDPGLRQYHSTVAASASGSFLVVWEDSQINNNRERILGQLYTAGGIASGAAQELSQPSQGDRRDPSVSLKVDGKALVAWQGTDRGRDVYARRFNLQEGAPVPTPTNAPPLPTSTPRQGGSNDDGCAITSNGSGSPATMLLLCGATLLLVFRRRA